MDMDCFRKHLVACMFVHYHCIQLDTDHIVRPQRCRSIQPLCVMKTSKILAKQKTKENKKIKRRERHIQPEQIPNV